MPPLTRPALKLVPETTAFFVCDIQDKFRFVVFCSRDVRTGDPRICEVLMKSTHKVSASKILKVPLIVTEQNPKGLGPTVPELDITSAAVLAPKTKFSMWIPEVSSELRKLRTTDVVLFGIESHVCVLQTAMDLIENDINVWVLADGVSSMNPGEIKIAVERMRAAGANITSSESVLFQLMSDAKHDSFKAIQNLVKETKETTKGIIDDPLLKIVGMLSLLLTSGALDSLVVANL
ncbi:Isochorismatase domain-containing protein 1 [Irineochytrium annulatum]|nr:Isochorismatase domain-containing protein 1 [Irineochytrium annulatum]